MTYEYDQGGNRIAKIDSANDRKVVYHYDIDKPLEYNSDNNRLMYYQTFDTNGRVAPDRVAPTNRFVSAVSQTDNHAQNKFVYATHSHV